MRRVMTACLRAAVFTENQLNTNGTDTHFATQHYRHDATYQTQFCMNMAATRTPHTSGLTLKLRTDF